MNKNVRPLSEIPREPSMEDLLRDTHRLFCRIDEVLIEIRDYLEAGLTHEGDFRVCVVNSCDPET